MSTSLFRIDEHVLPGQHIRGYPHGTAGEQEDVISISIKQYTPLSNPKPKRGDITIIGAHANGFPKELYEPLWDELLQSTERAGLRIRSIWIADACHQGHSSVVNEGKLGNDPSWFDHSRDLLLMVNQFRSQMIRPIIGVGHSMGGAHLTQLSIWHPRLFETLVLMDPVFSSAISKKGNFSPAQMSTLRRDLWPTRAAAGEAFKRNKFYQRWDSRVLDKWVQYGLRDLPTLTYPDVSSSTQPTAAAPATTEPTVTPNPSPAERPVTLTTTKHQEVLTFMRANFQPKSEKSRYTHPDLDYSQPDADGFYRPEHRQLFLQIPSLRPSVFYVFGTESDVSAPSFIEEKMATTGTGVGGSGGAAEGRVKQVTLQGVGHLIPMEAVEKSAELAVGWMKPEMERWKETDDDDRKKWVENPELTPREKAMMDHDFLRHMVGEQGIEKLKKGGYRAKL